jgi:hypothetical protein
MVTFEILPLGTQKDNSTVDLSGELEQAVQAL